MHCTSHMGKRLLLLLLSIGCCLAGFAAESYTLRGRVIDRLTRRPVAYAAVVLDGQGDKGASTDSTGRFAIERVRPGIYRLAASCIGYRNTLTPEYVVSAATPFIEIELVEDAAQLDAVTVTPTPFRRTAESPVGLQVIGLREIEKSPGANRDVSRIVRSYPGVSFSPVGYRNDLIVRGGGPSENVFYMDGIEIPNINHFATQGASGGPVSIVNADLVREISFYTGAFPADRAGALSSVLDFRLRDGDPEKHSFKATLGASEVSLSGNGPLSERTTYLFSVRQSYLQLLFKMLGLPFLPNYIDAQIKIKSKLSARDELTVLGLTGIDNMRLNTDEKGEEAEYLLSYLPRIRQETFTVGAVYRHYAGQHTQSVSLSHNYLNNRNLKYRDNDASSDENLMLRLRSVEQKTTLRGENRSWLGRWTLTEGAELNYRRYTNRTLQRLYGRETDFSDYDTRLGIAGWGLFFTAAYESSDKRFTASAGLRADGCDYSARMPAVWRQLSPRLSLAMRSAAHGRSSGSAGFITSCRPDGVRTARQRRRVGQQHPCATCASRPSARRSTGGCATGRSCRSKAFAKCTPIFRCRWPTAFRSSARATTTARWAPNRCVSTAEGRAYGVETDGSLADSRQSQPRRFGRRSSAASTARLQRPLSSSRPGTTVTWST